MNAKTATFHLLAVNPTDIKKIWIEMWLILVWNKQENVQCNKSACEILISNFMHVATCNV